jgi:hypothetical protein
LAFAFGAFGESSAAAAGKAVAMTIDVKMDDTTDASDRVRWERARPGPTTAESSAAEVGSPMIWQPAPTPPGGVLTRRQFLAQSRILPYM